MKEKRKKEKSLRQTDRQGDVKKNDKVTKAVFL